MRVTVIGAGGFVGTAVTRHLAPENVELRVVTRDTYAALAGERSDVVIDAAGNSRKYLAEERPFEEFDRSVAHRVRTLRDFPAHLHVHISSVDVYPDLDSPATTSEGTALDPLRMSHYGFHKWLAEEVVRHHAERWLIVRLAGMVGPGLRKNPVYDVLTGSPLRIHPDSQYQFMHTADVASCVWALACAVPAGDVVNVCGRGLISPREIANLAGRSIDVSRLDADVTPRIVHVNIEKLQRVAVVPETSATLRRFLAEEAGRT